MQAASFDRSSLLILLRLCHSLYLQPEYDDLRDGLKRILEVLNAGGKINHVLGLITPVDGSRVLRHLLGVLRTELLLEKEEKDRDGDTSDEDTGDDIGAPATDQDENAVDWAGQFRTLDSDEALKILVRNAIQEFGFAPRDVYDAIFHPLETGMKHLDSLKQIDQSMLKTIELFNSQLSLSQVSDRVVAVYPKPTIPEPPLLDEWSIEFKSPRIRDKAMEIGLFRNFYNLRDIYDLFHGVPTASVVAGFAFEMMVHHSFVFGFEQGKPLPQPIPMTSKGPTDLTFTTRNSPSSNVTPTPYNIQGKKFTYIAFGPHIDLKDVTLEENKYYVPTSHSNPLFDSFIIDHEEGEDSARISIFQMTISSTYRGSSAGYENIRKIMSHTKRLLKLENKKRGFKTDVKVRYFLVRPEDRTESTWVMPDGWDESVSRNDHRGDVFCLRFPTSSAL